MRRPAPRRAWKRLPVAVRFLVLHGLLGFGLSTLLTAAIVWTDPGGAAGVLLRTPSHPWPLLLLWFFLGLTLGGVQIAVAVMLRGTPDPPDDPPGGLREPAGLAPAKALARR